MEFVLQPSVKLIRVSVNAGLGRAIQPVDGKPKLPLPSLASPGVAAEVSGDVLPGFEDFPLLHLRLQQASRITAP
jgi:hypothetical protein